MGQIVKPFTWVLGVVLLIVGILGFFMPTPLLGLFEINTLHNIIHILSGLIGIGAAVSGYQASRLFLIIFGIVYGLVTILGFALPSGDILGLMMMNLNDNVLHLVISAACLIIGFGSPKGA